MVIMARYTTKQLALFVVLAVASWNIGFVKANTWKPVVARSFSSWKDDTVKPWTVEGQGINRRSDAGDVATPVVVPEVPTVQQPHPVKEDVVPQENRNARFVQDNGVSNEIDTGTAEESKANRDDPSNIIQGIFTDCVAQLSLTCVQKKVTVFMARLGRMERFGLVGDFLYVVRTAKDLEPEVREEDLKDDEDMEKVAERFFKGHVVRMTLPSWSDETSVESRAGTTLDISLPQPTAVEEGRKKKKGGKMMKKLLMMLGMAAAAKLALMIPLGLMVIKIKAMKALIIGKLALAISKFLLIKKLLMSKKGGGGGGGGQEKHIILVHSDGHGGGGGGGGHGGGGGGHGGGDSYGGPSAGGGGSYGGGGGGGFSSGGHGGGGDSGWSSGGGGGGGGGGGSGWSGGGGGGSSGGWGRATRSVDPHRIAYRGQRPTQ